MLLDEFLELFLKELKENKKLTGYYKIINNPSMTLFRKAYFEQRIKYVFDKVKNDDATIWDVGCGYGTTAILLALNGHHVTGSTLEFYYDVIQSRLDFWSRHGSLETLSLNYENLFDVEVENEKYDYVVAQDTLHHLEPISDALRIISDSLKANGKLLTSEENGGNILNNLKNFIRRGSKRIIEIEDTKLNKKILLGNENTRKLPVWQNLLMQSGLEIDLDSLEYVRIMPPFAFNRENYYHVIEKEQIIWKRYNLLKNYFFQGINFIAEKK